MGKTIEIQDVENGKYRGENTYLAALNALTSNGTQVSFGQAKTAYGHDFLVIRGTFAFDLDLPDDAVVVTATFKFKVVWITTDDGHYDLVVQSLAADHPFTIGAYNKALFTGNGGSKNTVDMSIGWVSIPLNATGKTWVLKGEDVLTKLGIRSSDDIAGVEPAGDDLVGWDYTAGWPKLEVVYTADPSVRSASAYSITDNTAYCRGNILNDHDDAHCDKIGICYNKTGNPTVADDKVEEDGTFSTGKQITKQLTGLDPGTKYYFKAYARNPTGYGYGDELNFTTTGIPTPILTNIGAENNAVFARTILTGDMDIKGATVVERGFEYKIQDAEPGGGDTGTEVKEIGAGFPTEEYSLKNKELYDQVEDTVWWFRAYCKDDGANKHVAASWMKNLPAVTTQAMTSVGWNQADGNGTIISKGASDLTERGFEVKHEYSGNLRDSWKFQIAGFEGELDSETTVNDVGVITGFYWAGDIIKTALETIGLGLGAYSITIGQISLGGWPIADDCLIEGKAYKCRAFASNEFGTVYGDEVDFVTTDRTYLDEDTPTIGEISIIKNEIIENLPIGVTATRRGFRYGTTEAADEFDVHENGSFTNGPYSMMLVDLLPGTTYYIIAYIVVDGVVYEGNLETLTTDPEGTEDEDEYPTPHFSPHGQDYREMSTKVLAEVLANQGIIDFSGGKKTLPIINHLIQTNPDAKVIADGYLARFQLAKTRMNVTFPTPLPFEREDTIDFSFGKVKFKENDLGVITFKEDGQGILGFMDQITMMIKKINSVGLLKTQTSIDYTAVLDLEHE